MEDVGTFTAPAQTNSRAGDDDTGQVEGETEKEVDTSHSDMSHAYDTGQVEDERVQMEASYSDSVFDDDTGRVCKLNVKLLQATQKLRYSLIV